MRDIVMYFAIKYHGDFKKIYDALNVKEKVKKDDLKLCKVELKYKYFTLLDKNYPKFFREGINPPIVMFYEGNVNLLNKDLPMEYAVMDDGTRMISTVNPFYRNGRLVFDYIVACENHDNVKELVEHIKSKGLNFKNYDISKKDKQETIR